MDYSEFSIIDAATRIQLLLFTRMHTKHRSLFTFFFTFFSFNLPHHKLFSFYWQFYDRDIKTWTIFFFFPFVIGTPNGPHFSNLNSNNKLTKKKNENTFRHCLITLLRACAGV